jgi:hypothetical protein
MPSRLWVRGAKPQAFVRGHDVSAAFEQRYQQLSPPLVRSLKYYRRFMPSGQPAGGDASESAASTTEAPAAAAVRLYGMYRPTEHDSDVEFYVDALQRRWGVRREGRQPHADGAAGAESYAQLQQLGERWCLFMGGISHQQYLWAQEKQGTRV